MKIIDSIGRCAASIIRSAVAATLTILALLFVALMLADRLAEAREENEQLNHEIHELIQTVDERDREILELTQRLEAEDQDHILTLRMELCLFFDSFVIFENSFLWETDWEVFETCAIGDEVTDAAWFRLGEQDGILFSRVFIEDMEILNQSAA